jgi:hypothetical protein
MRGMDKQIREAVAAVVWLVKEEAAAEDERRRAADLIESDIQFRELQAEVMALRER